MAEFNWWLLIVGLVVGAGLTWMVVADTRRREVDIEEAELPHEAAWLANVMADEGDPVSPATAERLVRLHRTYLALTGSGEEAEAAEEAAEADETLRPLDADGPPHPNPHAGGGAPAAPPAAPPSARDAPPSARDATDVQRDAAEPEPPVRHVG